VIASSSSKLLPTRLASRCIERGRVIVGHPLVPTHLIPLVEIVGGKATETAVVDWAVAFYASVGKHPLQLRQECEGYVANRLQRALFDEAIRLVEEGTCTFDDIDTAMTQGFGIRSPVLGPVLHRHLAGGAGGVRHMLSHLGWRGSERSAQALVSAIESRWGGKPIVALERWRDEGLVRILKSLRPPP
jgi:3-hydroxyacyl-CoA dehydrogenase